MSIFPEGGREQRWLRWAGPALLLVVLVIPALGTDPQRMITQYSRDLWTENKGFPDGSVTSIAQTPDGYLWIGTDKGLVRFDGVNFREFQQAVPESLPIGPVQRLVVDGQGNLWVLLQSTKVLKFDGERFESGREMAEFGVTAVERARSGTVVLASLAHGILDYRSGKFEVLPSSTGQQPASSGDATAKSDEYSFARFTWTTSLSLHHVAEPGSAVTAMAETSDGRLWLGTRDKGLFYSSDGRISDLGTEGRKLAVTCLLPLDNGELWIGTEKGVFAWRRGRLSQTPVSSLRQGKVLAMIRDRDANVWVGTDNSLIRVNEYGVTSSRAAGPVTALYEDREGSLWIGRAGGIERLQDSIFLTYSVGGLRSQGSGPIFVDDQGQTWFAPFEGGLRRIKPGTAGSMTLESLDQDVVYSIAGKKDEVWIGRRRGGLTQLRYVRGSFAARTYTPADGLAQDSVYAVFEGRDGTIWSGTLNGGVSELRNGHFTTYTTTNGLASNTVSSIAEGADGAMWFGTPNGLSVLAKNTWKTYAAGDGLTSPDVNCLLLDSSGILWIGTGGGLAMFREGRIQVPRNVPDALREPVFGLSEDRSGELWVATASHILQVKRSSLISDAPKESDYREFGLADGLQSTQGVKRFPSVVADAKGQIWFSTNHGLSVVNPARGVNSPPAIVHIEMMTADARSFQLRDPIKLPPSTEKTTFRFLGLSLKNAERIRYRYRLDGFDHAWSEPVTSREATYGNLHPGHYRFRVVASNSDGMWNGSETSLGFEVEPAFWQTWRFRLSCVACLGLATLLVHRLRTYQLTRLLNVRFEERLAERARVAQELHDTLLQGVVSASMQLHVAVDGLPDESSIRPQLSRVLKVMGQVIEEGRNTLRGMRSSIDNASDLESSLSRLPQELIESASADLRVVVEGKSFPLRPVVRDDVYGIGREALVNAFRHSGSPKVDLHLEYRRDQLRILVQDEGCGIDPQVLQSGSNGHSGLSAMRERAERIGAKLRILSRVRGGTEVELRVPYEVAFGSHPPPSSRWFTKVSKTGRGRFTVARMKDDN